MYLRSVFKTGSFTADNRICATCRRNGVKARTCLLKCWNKHTRGIITRSNKTHNGLAHICEVGFFRIELNRFFCDVLPQHADKSA